MRRPRLLGLLLVTAETIAQVRQLLDGPAQRVWINGVRHWISIEPEDEPFRIGRGSLGGMVPALGAKVPPPVVKPTCPDCGISVSSYANRCRSCSRVNSLRRDRRHHFDPPPEAKKCIDCSASLSIQTGTGAGPVRCQRCAAKERWRLKRAAKEAS